MEKNNLFLISLILGIVAFCIFSVVLYNFLSPTKPYNVLLVSVDTLRADRLNCYGYKKHITSPHIDALAGDGVLFENCIATSPWTIPSHLSILTSLFPTTHGVTMSMEELFKGFYDKEYRLLKLPENRVTIAEVVQNSGFATCAFTGGCTMDPIIGFDQGFEMYDTSMYKLDSQNMKKMYDWIKQNSNRPFFLFWHNFEVHAPYLHCDFLSDVLPKDTADLIRKEHSKLTKNLFRNVRLRYNENLIRSQKRLLLRHNAFNRDVCEALYLGGILSVDRHLGQLIQLLRDEGLYDCTVIVFTSDHGEEFEDRTKDHFHNKHGYSAFEEMIHVPLIIKLPYQEHAGTRVPMVSSGIDIMPTILDFLSITPDKNEMQGVSLMPLWEKSGLGQANVAYIEALMTPYEQKSLRTDDYKFIITIEPDTVSKYGRRHIPEKLRYRELYDLRKDSSEKKSLLWFKHSQTVDKLAAEFEQRIRKHISGQSGEAEPVHIDPIMIEKLKGLGYIGN